MQKMSRLLIYQVAKEVVHNALKQYPSAIPWFVGIYDDWTIGHLKHDPGTNHVIFRSEKFSERKFYDVCCFISEQIEKEINVDFIIHYANSNNDPGKLVVKQFIEAVTDLIMGIPVKSDNYYGSHSSDKPQRLIAAIPKTISYVERPTQVIPRATLDKVEILEKLKKIISKILLVDLESFTRDYHLTNDLGMNELDIIQLFYNMEEEFDIEFSDAENNERMTVEELVELIFSKMSQPSQP